MQLDTSSADQAKRDSIDWSPRIVYIRAAVADLNSPIVPFVVLKHDPRPGMSFEQESRRIFSGQPDRADAIREWWDAPLHALPADRRYFLLAWSAVEGASSRIVPVAGLAFGIATPGQSNKRWITTCALEYRGELVAWCEEIDMSGVQEDVLEVVLSEERMIRLLPGDADGRAAKVA
jgi:hypothetical protein